MLYSVCHYGVNVLYIYMNAIVVSVSLLYAAGVIMLCVVHSAVILIVLMLLL